MPANDPGRADLEEKRAICDALRDASPQTVEFRNAATVKARLLGSWVVPVNVNGRNSEWIFDNGANFSVVIESEAARVGLTILDDPD
jgi:predicted aspartyl protease